MTTRKVLRFATALTLAALMGTHWPLPSFAEDLGTPNGEVVLSIDGAIAKKNAGDRADFDMKMIQSMKSQKFLTSTPWTDGKVEFEGVPFKDLFETLGVTGTGLKAVALNDYIVNLDMETLISSGAILAYRMNGQEMSVRDKGPLWIMFPFDDRPQLKDEAIYSQSVWQLRKLTAQP
jgi:hypothetical protein